MFKVFVIQLAHRRVTQTTVTGNSSMQDESQMTSVKEEEILTADSGESTAGEDDFNPFGNSGSEDEGNVFSTLYLRLKEKIQESGLRTHFS